MFVSSNLKAKKCYYTDISVVKYQILTSSGERALFRIALQYYLFTNNKTLEITAGLKALVVMLEMRNKGFIN